MKKILTLGITAVLLCAGLMVSVAAAAPKGIDYNGFHYTLNLIGKKADFNGVGGGGSTMFVPQSTENMEFYIYNETGDVVGTFDGVKIDVENTGTEYVVTDGNVLDDGHGSFTLPTGKYAVYIAVKGKPIKDPNAEPASITGWMQYTNGTETYYFLDVGTITVKRNDDWVDASTIFYITNEEVGIHNDKDLSDPYRQLPAPSYIADNYLDYDYDSYNYKGMPGLWIFDYMTGLENLADDDLNDDLNYDNLDYFWQLKNPGYKLIKLRFYPI
ncbi:hypothetical protein MSMTP_2207 [Methanosarcina sp. MTP4]|uniref:hypothetical protein n=1 Tax=Methanosarcina sp. MTP4 TaxID=1434100 RepID=UPI000615D3F5|nr:hypothetical protein [Methanosarcina sp. MTP4]AKB25676.1 hypothetical protein MSMTP_2207 [Methanosarcina sp. MTP4]